MRLLGNILWFLICGFWQGISWFIVGGLWCISLIGIPIGIQCFKFSCLSFFPFGKDIVYDNGVASILLNIIWLIFGGLELALISTIIGLCLCITVVGIPFAMQCFKLSKLALMPFGAKII